MKKKKGFTLIELLAVIVILAIIALIATPIILGIVEDARKDSFMRSVELVIKATDLDVTLKLSNEGYEYKLTDGKISENMEVFKYEIDKDACVEFMSSEWGYYEDEAISECNNEPQEWYDGMTLIEWFNSSLTSNDAQDLINSGAIVKVYVIRDYDELNIVKNATGMNGKIKYDKNGNESYAIHNGKYCAIKEIGVNNVEITKYDGECNYIEYTPFDCFETELAYEYEIIDVNKCITYFDGRTYDEDYEALTTQDATSICNNNPDYYYNFSGLPLTEYLGTVSSKNQDLNNLLNQNIVKKVETDGIIITDYKCSNINHVIIPRFINNKKVISIGEESFTDIFPNEASIVLPSTINRIGSYAFAYVQFRNSIDLSSLNELKWIGSGAFMGMVQYFADSVVDELLLPSSIVGIGESVFYLKNIKSIDLTSLTNLKYIGASAFDGLYLESVELPSNVIYVGDNAFGSMYGYNSQKRNQISAVKIHGKDSISDFEYFGTGVFGWADGYSDDDIQFIN